MLLITGPQRARSKINWARAVLERPIARVEELALAIALAVAAPELETGPVAALELVIGLAMVPELVIGPAVVPELELVQVAVALRTKSATGADRQDLVPLLTAEASAVAGVETSLAPAAAGAVKAWEAVE